ncbi:MAG: MBL fold metallo-hydrolase [Bacteroidia bacterium]
MKLSTIHTGNFKLDGGAMFGVVPKMLWNKINPADENNMCNWAMRCLLIEVNDRKILIDTGIGNKQSEKFYSHYYLNGSDSLANSLNEIGVGFDEITDVLLTHLHFDHCGGAVTEIEGKYSPSFPNATYYTTKSHWFHANNPNPRERASFLHENFNALMENNVLKFVKEGDFIADVIEIMVFNGHTIGMIAPLIHLANGNKLFFGADLIPSSGHLKPNFVMSYDIQPLVSMEERERINAKALESGWFYFYEHDLNVEVSNIHKNERNAYVIGETFSLEDIV